MGVERDKIKELRDLQSSLRKAMAWALLTCFAILFVMLSPYEEKQDLTKPLQHTAYQEQNHRSEDPVKVAAEPMVGGLIQEGDYQLVYATCAACHSIQLVTQNRATAEGWHEMIDWMQSTQGLWNLGEKEEQIVAYLAKYYAPEQVGRRKALQQNDWYLLEPEETNSADRWY